MHAQKWILIESKVLKEIPEEDKTMEIVESPVTSLDIKNE